MKNLDTLARLGVGAPTSSREYVINKAEESLAKARAAAGKMMPQKISAR